MKSSTVASLTRTILSPGNQSHEPRHDRANRRGGSILVVDDEPAPLQFLERLLAFAGYTNVHITTDPNEALALNPEYNRTSSSSTCTCRSWTGSRSWWSWERS